MIKCQKNIKQEAKKFLTKNQLLLYKKYPHLVAYNLRYDVVNRGYKRYLRNIDDYIEKNGLPSYWFTKTTDSFSRSVRVYLVAKENNYNFQPLSRGDIAVKTVQISGLDRYLRLYE